MTPCRQYNTTHTRNTIVTAMQTTDLDKCLFEDHNTPGLRPPLFLFRQLDWLIRQIRRRSCLGQLHTGTDVLKDQEPHTNASSGKIHTVRTDFEMKSQKVLMFRNKN